MKKERRRLYEGMYIISATLSEDTRNKALKKITEGIEKRGGEVHKIHEMGKRRLAYEIARKREGYYYVVFFSIASSLISQLWEDYHLHEDLIRFLTLSANNVQEKLEFKPIKQS